MHDRRCEFPDTGLVERVGACKLSHPPKVGVTLYEHEGAQGYRERMNVRQVASRHLRQAIA
jgi:hypothetical protein